MLIDKLVTIIIPVYNVESYIERCARSLYEQTYRYIEYIWVDDSSPDSSIDIVRRITDEYPNRKAHVKIIHHEENKGLPTARNSGLSEAHGDYIFHCDSDDWADKDMIRQFIHKAVDENADIVYSDWYLSFSRKERYMIQPSYADSTECVKSMLSGSMRYNVWNKLVRRSVYSDNAIAFPDGRGMGEDMTMIKLFACAQRIAHIPKAFYHYMQVNSGSFTKVYSEKHHAELFENVNHIKSFIYQRYGGELAKHVHFFLLNVKLPLLITNKSESYEHWLQRFSESDHYISENTGQSMRTRWLQQMAVKRRFWLVRIHYYLVIKFVYGVVYR